MAFENAYGETLNADPVFGYYDESNDSYAEALENLLPRGPAWVFATTSEMYALLRGLSYSYLRAYQRGLDLLEEFDPRTTVDMLEDWERVLELPGTNPNPPTSLENRRGAVLAKLRGYGDPTPAYYTALAEAIGYYITIISTPYDPFVAGSLTGLPLTSDEWVYVWDVYCWEAELTVDNTPWLEWTLDSLKPDHTLAVYRYFLTQQVTTPATMMLWAVAYDTVNNQWCAVGETSNAADASIVTSPNGLDWTERANPKAYHLYAVAHNGLDTWVSGGQGDGVDAYLLSSPDAQTWTEQANPKNIGLNGAAFGAGVFVAVGNADGADAYIITSPNGAAPWTERANAKNKALYAVAHNGLSGADSLFVAVGEADGTDAYILTSADGATWAEKTNPKNFSLRGVTYGNGLWVAVGDSDGVDNYIITSEDGITWAEVTNPGGATLSLYGVTYSTEAGFVAVGEADGVKALLFTSWDGTTWIAQDNPENFNLIGVAVDNYGRPVAVGYEDTGGPVYNIYLLAT
jgi:uncharacterized protein YmfQ (DUF2313 family)